MSISSAAFLSPSACLDFSPYGVKSLVLCDGVIIDHGALLAPFGGSIHLAENVFVGPYCVLYGHGGLSIGRNTMIATHCVLVPANHIFQERNVPIRDQSYSAKGISIGEDVWLGCGVRVLDGVSIGKGCVVGAGAVVTRSLPDYAVALGVPARVHGWRGDTPGQEPSNANERSG